MTYTTNINMKNLIGALKQKASEEKVKIWKAVAEDLEKPTRIRRVVNISKLNKVTASDEIVIVPGKVLGSGEIDHKLTVAAFTFSEQAKDKINKNGSAITITKLLEQNPKGKKVRIIG